MSLSLDTTTVVDLLKGDRAVKERLRTCLANGELVVVSAVVLEELVYGAAASGASERELRKVEVALTGLQLEPMTADDARLAGQHRARQRAAGLPLGAYDGLIAGHARARGWTLVTSDQKLMRNIMDVPVENWREPQ